MTLRYNHLGKPIGLDWSVCTDGNPRPEIWGLKADTPKPARAPGVPRTRTQLTPVIERQVIELYTEGQKSALQIADQVGIASASVFKILRRNDVPTRSKSDGMRLRRGT